MVSWREREARNEVLYRAQNEWIEATSSSYGAADPLMVFVCECVDPDCAQTIELTRLQYESVRAAANRFAIAPDHENPEVEVVVRDFPLRGRRQGRGLGARDCARQRPAIGQRTGPGDATLAGTSTGTPQGSGGSWLIALVGEHDIATTAALDQQTRDVPSDCVLVVVDLSAATFIDCSVVKWLLRTRSTLTTSGEGVVRIVEGPPGGSVHRVLDLVGLDEELPRYSTRETALTKLPAEPPAPLAGSAAGGTHSSAPSGERWKFLELIELWQDEEER